MIELKITDQDTARTALDAADNGDPSVLRDLCRKEAGKFDKYLREFGQEYSDGLSRFERLAVEGYIYQKIRGRVDGKDNTVKDISDSGGEDGS